MRVAIRGARRPLFGAGMGVTVLALPSARAHAALASWHSGAVIIASARAIQPGDTTGAFGATVDGARAR